MSTVNSNVKHEEDKETHAHRIWEERVISTDTDKIRNAKGENLQIWEFEACNNNNNTFPINE